MARDHGVAVLTRPDAPIHVDTRGPREAGRHRRRAVALLLLDAVVPGTGHLAAGSRRVGRAAVKTWLGLVVAALLVGLLGLVSRTAALTLATQTAVLTVLQVLLVGLAVAWAALLVDAWRLGRPDRLPQRDRRRLLGLLVVVLLAPALVGYAGLGVGTARASMSAIFAAGDAAGAVDGRYNILLLGGDSGKGRVGMRPDSIQLASVDADTGRAVLFGFSRETENIRFREGSVMAGLMPEGWTCGDECLLNGIYTWAQDNADLFPPGTQQPGVLATREAVESLSGLEVQYHVLVDLKGFRSLVDAVGGVDVTVQRRTPMGSQSEVDSGREKGWIEEGRQHLDGYHALWYARSRADSTNYERMARQRCVVTALVKGLDPQTVALNFGDIATATTGIVSTDIPQGALPGLADLAVRTQQEKITSVNFVPPLIEPWDYDPQVVRSAVAAAVRQSEEPPAPATKAADPTPSASGAAPAPQPSRPAVMERPGIDPDARTGDLADVCAAG